MSSNSGTVHYHFNPGFTKEALLTKVPAELDDIVSTHCPSHALIDNALRAYLSFTTNYKGPHVPAIPAGSPEMLNNTQESISKPNTTLHGALTSFWSLHYLPRKRTMSGGKSSIAFFRYSAINGFRKRKSSGIAGRFRRHPSPNSLLPPLRRPAR